MIRVLDTNTFIASLNGNAKVLRRLDALLPEDVILCAPVLAELVYGARCSAREAENLGKLEELLARTRFQEFSLGAAFRFGELKASLRKRGRTKDDFDLAIAAVALDLKAVLVSNDTDFHDGAITGIQVENWLER
ncbi:MAG TPA: PIN domain-containing protein [Thermoanaerobaculia bacterium]|nr:PIN domain-containing protein [Thermoanaerobaculia bacterium]